MNNEVINEIKRLMSLFPDSFINHNMELILIPKTNTYFMIEDCATKNHIIAKVLMWCVRPIVKGQPYRNEQINIDFRDDLHIRLVKYLDADWLTTDDLELIYQKLGNAVKQELTYKFIDSGFDMEILKGQ